MIKKFLDLGKHPLANKYIKKQNLKKKEDCYKLEIKFNKWKEDSNKFNANIANESRKYFPTKKTTTTCPFPAVSQTYSIFFPK